MLGSLGPQQLDRPTDTSPGSVLIAGITSELGRRLTRLLHRHRTVIGVDRQSFLGRPKDVAHFELDPRSRKVRELFRRGEVKAIIHLGLLHAASRSADDDYAWNIAGFQKILDYMGDLSVPKLVFLSSAAVYGPRPDNPHFLTEDAPLLGGGATSELGGLSSLDLLAQSFLWKWPPAETVILRPVHMLGPFCNAASNYLRLKLAPTLLGFDPLIQVIHVNDVALAVQRALLPGVRGIFNLAGPSPCLLSDALRLLRRQQLRLPLPVARFGIEHLCRWGMSNRTVSELDFLRFVCMVDDRRAREVLGHRPQHGLKATLQAVDEEDWA